MTPLRLQHGVGREEAGRLHVDDEGRARVQRGEVARQHDADLVGEDLVALVVDHAAAVAVAVEAEPDIGAVLPHRVAPWRAASPCLRGWDCSAGRCGRARRRAGSTSQPSASRICGAKAPAVPLPQAATTLSLRVIAGRVGQIGDVALRENRRRNRRSRRPRSSIGAGQDDLLQRGSSPPARR